MNEFCLFQLVLLAEFPCNYILSHASLPEAQRRSRFGSALACRKVLSLELM